MKNPGNSTGKDYRERHSRDHWGPSFRRQEHSFHYRQEDKKTLVPMPLGDRCSPLCPFFMCGRGALLITNKMIRGRVSKVAQCRMTGENCLGGECQYAGCKLNALLPDGRCAKALEKKTRQISEEDLFREMEKFEDYDVKDFTG